MTGLKIWAVSLLAFLSTAQATVRKYTLELNNDVIAPDGYKRSGVVVNHQYPGTLIQVNKHEQLQVKVVNKLTDKTMAQGTSIHWHGIFQHRHASQDGVAWVSQCPIAPGDTYLYNFNVGEQTGTYWYHSHVTTQYCDGLVGPLVIYDPNDPLKELYDVDNENTVITLSDWFHLPSPKVLQTFAYPQAHLINGLGREPGAKREAPLAIVNVERHKRYRFRLLNAACLAGYNFSIDGHDLTVIETEGTETIPKTVGVVTLWPGQRVSVVVNANQKVDNYWMRSIPFITGIPVSNETGVNSAILRYAGAKKKEPRTKQTNFELLREEELVPLIPSDISIGEPDIKINLNIGVTKPMGEFTVNGYTYKPPTLPVLLQILSGKVNPHTILPNGTVFTLPRNKLVEISIPGDSPLSPHPFHLHGHQFAVTRSAGSKKINTWNPPLRDVVNAGNAGDNVTFRFRTDNPGPWFLHCHIDLHLEAGLAVVFAEDPKAQISGPDAEEFTKAWEDLCPRWEALKSGKQYSVSDLEG
ncbi:hypothetical protein AX17_007059 [Amanita inopinata Kibby_2008]|nr:hypothetical protein AX17_007059 [Amanita inopinata Kibby_2008]